MGSQEAAKTEAPREAHENSRDSRDSREREQGAALDYRFQPSADQTEVRGENWDEEPRKTTSLFSCSTNSFKIIQIGFELVLFL